MDCIFPKLVAVARAIAPRTTMLMMTIPCNGSHLCWIEILCLPKLFIRMGPEQDIPV